MENDHAKYWEKNITISMAMFNSYVKLQEGLPSINIIKYPH